MKRQRHRGVKNPNQSNDEFVLLVLCAAALSCCQPKPSVALRDPAVAPTCEMRSYSLPFRPTSVSDARLADSAGRSLYLWGEEIGILELSTGHVKRIARLRTASLASIDSFFGFPAAGGFAVLGTRIEELGFASVTVQWFDKNWNAKTSVVSMSGRGAQGIMTSRGAMAIVYQEKRGPTTVNVLALVDKNETEVAHRILGAAPEEQLIEQTGAEVGILDGRVVAAWAGEKFHVDVFDRVLDKRQRQWRLEEQLRGMRPLALFSAENVYLSPPGSNELLRLDSELSSQVLSTTARGGSRRSACFDDGVCVVASANSLLELPIGVSDHFMACLRDLPEDARATMITAGSERLLIGINGRDLLVAR